MDVAAFKVSHSIGIDEDATTLRAVRARSSSMGAMERYTWVQFAGKLTNCHKTHIAKVSIPLGRGVMERYMRGFDLAPELTPGCHNTPQTVSIPVGRWRKRLGKRFKRQTLCTEDADPPPPVMSNPISSAVPPYCISKTRLAPMALSTTLPGTCASMVRARSMQTAEY